ncbi:MAG: hypothetical protein JWQ07_5491 [Ramlibacter sp.]|nr:hypothetical protein [Ramlibacter sp.]
MGSTVENRWANDIDGSALAAQPGKSQGRPLKSSGSNTHRPETAYPTCVLPEGPSSQSAEPMSAAGCQVSLRAAVSCPEKQHSLGFKPCPACLLPTEGEGFEPPVPVTRDNGFQDRRIQPLCHPSGAFQSHFESAAELSREQFAAVSRHAMTEDALIGEPPRAMSAATAAGGIMSGWRRTTCSPARCAW